MFLQEKISFLEIAGMIEQALSDFHCDKQEITLEEILCADKETRMKLGG